jgi:hypothetical protein
MNKFKFYFILSITTFFIFMYKKIMIQPKLPKRIHSVQYATDLSDDWRYLKTYYIEVKNNSGSVDDQDVTITKIPEGGAQNRFGIQTDYQLKNREVSCMIVRIKCINWEKVQVFRL